MEYLGKSIPKLGFGFMRLPKNGDEVDMAQTQAMVDLFLEQGFTYFDTSFNYLNGTSETILKEVLVDRYPRDSFQLATKLPAWDGAATKEEAEQMFWTSLERTGAGYFDFYLLHNLGDERTEFFNRYDIWSFLRARRDEGLIKHLGFSFHDKADVLDKILTENPDMEFVQLQINYADWESASIQSRLCYETARKHGKPVIIMEPVKGGSLCTLPTAAEELLKNAAPEASIASWAVRFAASLDGLVTVLSGMSTLEQVRDNTAFMSRFRPLSESEQQLLTQVRQILDSVPQIPCTGCNYCTKGCPQEIAIPGIFKAMNNYLIFNNMPGALGNYGFNTRHGGVASKCIECGQCESVCPQHISIIQELRRAKELLER